ncbi:mucoidy inhibitor MuiA family protein [Pedobacter sp. Hv1]|uniref:mucoidy inhibitor MuiA family protein n=1 Tax=Pedobacter sp. Hv1 TaxID=1740090 RepID=UPI0006D8B1D8|nr:mucoidy inhibitor MuiA family protein [Pedobacter sp. Hv1]KQC02730.1 hypothetical protein AQF98_03925 [Pedobacter sp. Hv1]
MKNFFFFNVLALLICTSAIAQETQIPVNSKISHVTVFISGAQIQRQTESVDIPQGVSQLVFTGVSSVIEAQSIQAKGEGNFTILSVAQQKNYLLERKNSDQKTAYLNNVTSLNDKIIALRNESDVYKAEEEMLIKNQVVMGPNVNYDLVKLKQALDFQKQRLTEAKNKQIEINKEVGKLQIELDKYRKQINEIDSKGPKNSNDIVVKVSAKTATKGKFQLTYMVNNAGWYPTYDIRATDVSSPIALVYKANVSQSSEEDWKNVKLTLSSGNPTTSSVKPSLGSYNIGFLSAGYFGTGTNSAIRSVKGRVVDTDANQVLPGVSVRVKNTSVGTVTDASGNFSLQIPVGANVLVFSYIGFDTQEQLINANQFNIRLRPSQQMLQEVVVTGYGEAKAMREKPAPVALRGMNSLTSNAVEVSTVEKQTNVTFDIQNPYTILSDGKQFSVDIGNYDFKADYEYYAAPKISSEAFLTAKISGFNEINLISGEANVFFEGTFLGKTLLDVQNAADTLTLSLGVDKNLVIKREKQKDFNERQFMGSSQRDSRHFVIDIKNRKSQAVNLIVQDQLPISTSNDISVEKQEISKAQLDESNGLLTWKMLLQPNEQKKLVLKYQVKYPKNKPVNIE